MRCTNVIILANSCLILKAPSLTTWLIKGSSSWIIHYCSQSLQLNYRSKLAESLGSLSADTPLTVSGTQSDRECKPRSLPSVNPLHSNWPGRNRDYAWCLCSFNRMGLMLFATSISSQEDWSLTGLHPQGTRIGSSTSSDTAKCIFSGEFHNKMTVIYHYKPLYHLVNKRPLSLTFFSVVCSESEICISLYWPGGRRCQKLNHDLPWLSG